MKGYDASIMLIDQADAEVDRRRALRGLGPVGPPVSRGVLSQEDADRLYAEWVAGRALLSIAREVSPEFQNWSLSTIRWEIRRQFRAMRKAGW